MMVVDSIERGSERINPLSLEGLAERLLGESISLMDAIVHPAMPLGVLHEFACDITERHLRMERTMGRDVSPECWALLKAKRAWLNEETTSQELDIVWRRALPTASEALPVERDAAWMAIWAGWHGEHDTWTIQWALDRIFFRLPEQPWHRRYLLELLREQSVHTTNC
jgi:hypothetical protein